MPYDIHRISSNSLLIIAIRFHHTIVTVIPILSMQLPEQTDCVPDTTPTHPDGYDNRQDKQDPKVNMPEFRPE